MLKRIFTLVAMLCVATIFTNAQTTGRLSGTVMGPDGAIPGATVVLTDNKTGKKITVQTNGGGNYAFPQVDFGTYTVSVSAPGFKTATTNDVKIDIGRERSLSPTLEIGEIAETVIVQAGEDIINTSNSELSSTINPRQIIELPLNGRDPLELVTLQAGANATSASVNGQRSTAQNITRDGINVQDQFIRATAFVNDRPTIDDTGEFTVTTQNAGAEQGGGGSTQIQLVTPRGGDSFHGAGFIYNRNSAFAANNFFNNSDGVERPILNRNQVGGKLSGPLPFPHFGEGGPLIDTDKAFFFVSYEKLILRQQTSGTLSTLLGTARDGTFSYTDNNGVLRTVNVLTGKGLNAPIPGTSGGVLGIDPVIQSRILNNLPTTGNGNLSNNGLTQTVRLNASDNFENTPLSTRIDYEINDRNSLNFVYRRVTENVDRPGIDVSFDGSPFVVQTNENHLITGSYKTIFGSNFTNDFRLGYTQGNPFFNQDSSLDNAAFIFDDIPFATNPEPTFRDQGRDTQLFTIRDDAVYSTGNHSIRFGGQLEKHNITVKGSGGTIPSFSISDNGNFRTPGIPSNLFPGGISSVQRGRADSLRYLLGGVIGSGIVTANPTSNTSGPVLGASSIEKLRWNTLGLYLSDQWKITPSLTLNYGIRYDLFTGVQNPDQVLLEPIIPQDASNLDDVRAALLDPNGTYDYVGTSLGNPGQLFKSDKNNFAPQFGIAWTPQDTKGFFGTLLGAGKTTFRGGYRISYINDEYLKAALNAARGNDGLVVDIDAVDVTANGTTTSLNRRAQDLDGSGFPVPSFTAPPITFAQANARDNFFNTIFAVDPNFSTPRIHEYNAGIQRDIGYDTVVEVRYVGGSSNNLARAFDFNQVNIRNNGLVEDFVNSQFNLANFGVSDCRLIPAANRPAGCRTVGAFFDQLGPGGVFPTSGFTTSQLRAGTPGQFALNLVLNSTFFPGARDLILNNPNGGVVDVTSNEGSYRYNSLQAEVRRRFSDGFSLQANYTFQKTLTDVPEEDQNRFDPYLDIENPGLEYSRGDFDRTHAFNFNAIYELPFGKGKTFFDNGGIVNTLFGGFQLSAIVQMVTGAPISIRDPRGTLNRTGRSPRQTANSSLTTDEIKSLTGIFRTSDGVFFIDPSVIAPDGTATGSNVTATENNPAFAGQVFFNVPAGETGLLERAFINGPKYINLDLGLRKRIRFNERFSLVLRGDVFNALNRSNFRAPTGPSTAASGENSAIFNINSTNFGRISSTYAPRIMQFAARFEF